MRTYTSQSMVFGTKLGDSLLMHIDGTSGGALDTNWNLHLSHDPSFALSPQSQRAALIANEVNFSGYAGLALAGSFTVPVNASSTCVSALTLQIFEAVTASPFVSDTAYGWWIDDGTDFICGEKFANGASFDFVHPNDYLSLALPIPCQLIQQTS